MPDATIWVIGREGSGKTTLITVLPQNVLRVGWVLRPEGDATERRIYRWQYRLYQEGKFPPRDDPQAEEPLTFSRLSHMELKKFYESGQLPDPKRTIEVHEHTIPHVDRGLQAEFYNELRSAARRESTFSVIFCVPADQVDDYGLSEDLKETVAALSVTRGSGARICVAITKADILANTEHNNIPISRPSSNGNGRELDPEGVGNALDLYDQQTQAGDSRRDKRAQQYLEEKLLPLETMGKAVGAVEFCTAIGLARDDVGKLIPNVKDGGADGEVDEIVYDSLQIWSSGIYEVFLRTQGEVRR